MTARPSQVYVVQGRGPRDFADAQRALDSVPAKVITLPFIGDDEDLTDQVSRRRGGAG